MKRKIKLAFGNAVWYSEWISKTTICELQELLIDTEANDHRQRNVLKEAIVNNRKKYFDGDSTLKEKIHFDSPLFFDVDEILMYIKNRNNEKKDKNNNIPYKTAGVKVFSNVVRYASSRRIRCQ